MYCDQESTCRATVLSIGCGPTCILTPLLTCFHHDREYVVSLLVWELGCFLERAGGPPFHSMNLARFYCTILEKNKVACFHSLSVVLCTHTCASRHNHSCHYNYTAGLLCNDEPMTLYLLHNQ